MFSSPHPIVLSELERQELEVRSRARSISASDGRRARLILLLADGLGYAQIEARLDCSEMFIRRWKKRFLEHRLEGLFARHQGRRPAPEARRLEARILAATRQAPPDG